jgi:hypothetical protein
MWFGECGKTSYKIKMKSYLHNIDIYGIQQQNCCQNNIYVLKLRSGSSN